MKTRKDIDTLPVGANCPKCGIKQKYSDVTRHKSGCDYASKPHHTPTPWKIAENDPSQIVCDATETRPYGYVVADATGYKGNREANAAYIVRAVNSHAAMSKALVQAWQTYGHIKECEDLLNWLSRVQAEGK